MLKISKDFINLKAINKQLDYVNKMLSMKKDKRFQQYIKDKCMNELENIMNELLIGGTTNDEYINVYRECNHIKDEENGFVIYNDAKIPANTKHPDNYPNGEFSLALAFEYGVGIVGEGTYTNDKFTAWDYNINNYNFGWYYKQDGELLHSYGYQGFEIYRKLAIEIENNINKWVNDYYMEV